MTTHLDTSPNLFALSAPRVERADRLQTARPSTRERGRVGAFVGVLLGNIVLWSTFFITIGVVLALQLGLVGLVAASLLR